MQLWVEIRDAGGSGTVNLRGLDPTTCTAIDTLVEQIIAEYGNIKHYWGEVLDPDGDGVCSRSEFVTYTKKAMGISSTALDRIYSVLDLLNSGWVASSEVAFLDAFMPYVEPEQWQQFDSHMLSQVLSIPCQALQTAAACPLAHCSSAEARIWSCSNAQHSRI
jgi:hypothetical protein